MYSIGIMVTIDQLILLRSSFMSSTKLPLHKADIVFKDGPSKSRYNACKDCIEIDKQTKEYSDEALFADMCKESARSYQRHKFGLILYKLLCTVFKQSMDKTPTEVGIAAFNWYMHHKILRNYKK